IKHPSLAARETEGLALGNLVGGQAAVLPIVDERSKLTCRPALLVNSGSLDDLLQKPDLIVVVKDSEAGFEADKLGMSAEYFHANGVKRSEPLHAFERAADQAADALAHFARGLVCEVDGENLRGVGTTRRQDVGDARRQYASLAGAGPGKNKKRPIG